jgi:hypothetical protein
MVAVRDPAVVSWVGAAENRPPGAASQIVTLTRSLTPMTTSGGGPPIPKLAASDSVGRDASALRTGLDEDVVEIDGAGRVAGPVDDGRRHRPG